MEATLTKKPSAETPPAISVLGLGNPLLCDDTVGLLVVEHARSLLSSKFPFTRFSTAYSGGFELFPELEGFNRAIIVDSLLSESETVGECLEYRMRGDGELPWQPRLSDSHGLCIADVLSLCAACGYAMPSEITVLGIVGSDFTTFSEKPTPQVAAAIPTAVSRIGSLLSSWYSASEDYAATVAGMPFQRRSHA